jgi:CxxC-x17-CxxC domain-containing protein
MKNFKRNNTERSFRPNRPFRKDRDQPDSRPRFNADRSVRRFDRDGDKPPHRSSRTLEMFDVTCARCGNACQIPFKPMTNKPVYCRDCFNKKDNFEPKGPETEQPSQLDIINKKLDKIMRALKIN